MRLKNVLLTVGSVCACAVLSSLYCSLDVAGGSTETTNTKIAGMLYNPKGSPAANAKVLIVTADHIPISANRKSPAIIDTTVTDSNGNYSFDSLTGGYYNIFGEGDSGISYADSILIKNDTGNNLPPDTLKEPGSLSGIIRLQPEHDSRTILILVFGSLTWTMPVDSIGNFTLANMAEGTYTVRFLTTLDDYLPLDTRIAIRAGMSGILSDTLYMPFTGIPTPTGLKHVYDTANQIVTLSWNAADTSLIQGYYLYRKHKDSSAVRLNSTPIPDTLYIDSLKDGGPPFNGTYFYYVTAVDKNFTEGPKSILDSIFIKGNCQGWTPKNAIAPRMEHHCLTIDNTLYCVGGVDNAGAIQSLMKYNPANDTWENLAPIPKPRTGASACAADGKIYYFGGKEATWYSSNYEYDPIVNLWNKKISDCILGKDMAVCGTNDTLFVVGGSRAFVDICDSMCTYYPVNDIWTARASMNICRTKLVVCSVNGLIYAIGGYDGINVLSDVEEYDPNTDTWTTKSPMPTARMSPACCVLNNKIHVLGGFDGTNVLSTVEMYDPAIDQWTAKSPMPTARQALSAAVVNGKILAVGGRNGSEIIGVVEEFNPYNE